MGERKIPRGSRIVMKISAEKIKEEILKIRRIVRGIVETEFFEKSIEEQAEWEIECTKCGWQGKARDCDIVLIDEGRSAFPIAIFRTESYYVCPRCKEYKGMKWKSY